MLARELGFALAVFALASGAAVLAAALLTGLGG